MPDGMCVYGVIKDCTQEKFDFSGIGGGKVYTIHHNGIAAIVSNSPISIEITEKNVSWYEKVIREVMLNYTIIPMGFGTIARNNAEVKKILRKGYHKFKDVLKKMDNKVQIDVKTLWDEQKILIDILRENEEIQRLREVITKHEDPNKKIELGKKVKLALDKKKEEYLTEIEDVLTRYSDDLRPKNFIEKDVVIKINENETRSGKLIMDTSILVKRDKEREFYDKVNELDGKYKKIELILVGPLPPYTFAQMEIKKTDFRSIDAARKLLGLSEEVTRLQLKDAYHELVHKYHPDRNPDPSSKENFKKIEKAYVLLSDYCHHYPCSFRKPEVEKTFMIISKGMGYG